MMYRPGFGGWGFGLMGLGMLLFWALLLAAVVVVIRYLVRANRRADGPPAAPAVPAPERILAERFAHGDIDEQEYRHRLDVLRGTPPGAGPPGSGDGE